MSNAYDEIAKLSPEERALLEQLMREEGVDISNLPISRINRTDNIPLSFSQERLWSIWNLAPENPSENVFISFEIKGKLKIDTLENAVNEIINRNEIFRTICVQKEDGVYQQIISELKLKIEEYNFTGFSEEEKKSEAKKFIENEITVPFVLTKLPIFRMILLKLGEDHHIITVLTHQFISDGFTANLLLQKISEYYNQLLNSQSISGENENFDYADFAVWHRKRIEGNFGSKQLDYWKEKIKMMPTQLRFPTLKKSGDKNGKADTFSFSFTTELSDNIRSFAEREGYSVFMILLSGLQVTLSKMTRQEKILVTTSVSTRGIPEIEKMFGNFSNNLLFCSDFNKQTTFKDVLISMRSEVGGAFENQDLPLEHLVSVLQNETAAFSIPRIQVLFMLRDKNSDDLFKLTDLELTKFPVDFQFSKLDLLFDIFTAKNEISINITYKKDLFAQEIISEISRVMNEVLSIGITKQASKISDLTEFRLDDRYQLNELYKAVKTTEFIAPRSDVEKGIAEIWQEILGVDNIGINDDFLELGGHSLLLTRIVMRVRKKFNVALSLSNLFATPTIAAFTQEVEKAKNAGADNQTSVISAVSRDKYRIN